MLTRPNYGHSLLLHTDKITFKVLKHLPNVETHFYSPQPFLSLDFLCRDDVSEFK